MPFVLDASVVARWPFDDENHPVAESALERVRTDEARVPSLWWFKVRNRLIVNERRGRLTESDTAEFLHGLSRLRVTVGRSPSEAEFLRLPATAASQSVTSHILNSRGGAPLATLDAALATAARAERVPLLSY